VAAAASLASSSCQGPLEGGDEEVRQAQLRDWFQRRMSEIKVQFDSEVLWTTLSVLSDGELRDEEVLKMWLGLSSDDKLPHELSLVVCEFRQHRQILHFTAG